MKALRALGSLGSLWLIVRRSLRQHALSTAITVLSSGLGAGLVMAIFSLQEQTQRAFEESPVGFRAIYGPKGSKLQLVLNSVFHLESSPGNIPWSRYVALKEDRRRVEWALPYLLGDNYYGHRILGTTVDIFDVDFLGPGKKLALAQGAAFDATRADAVIGSAVAERRELRVGSKFQPYHGLAFDPAAVHAIDYVVTGILAPTGSPMDQVILIPIEGSFRMDGHALVGTDEKVYQPKSGELIPDKYKEVSAVLVQPRGHKAAKELDFELNRQDSEKLGTFVYPIDTIVAEFFRKVAWIADVLKLVAFLVGIVAAGTILASLYNTMNERRREFAILRALGARRSTVFGAIVLESSTIAALGALFGFAVYLAIFGAAAWIVEAQTGVLLEILHAHPIFVLAPVGLIALGALSGVVPALRAYRTDVASHLVPSS
ncbi:MAG: ABC transporter permease [Planctomycetes bacterium]|nr:ABC transporter permease [Planctomycetota bacterium]